MKKAIAAILSLFLLVSTISFTPGYPTFAVNPISFTDSLQDLTNVTDYNLPTLDQYGTAIDLNGDKAFALDLTTFNNVIKNKKGQMHIVPSLTWKVAGGAKVDFLTYKWVAGDPIIAWSVDGQTFINISNLCITATNVTTLNKTALGLDTQWKGSSSAVYYSISQIDLNARYIRIYWPNCYNNLDFQISMYRYNGGTVAPPIESTDTHIDITSNIGIDSLKMAACNTYALNFGQDLDGINSLTLNYYYVSETGTFQKPYIVYKVATSSPFISKFIVHDQFFGMAWDMKFYIANSVTATTWTPIAAERLRIKSAISINSYITYTIPQIPTGYNYIKVEYPHDRNYTGYAWGNGSIAEKVPTPLNYAIGLISVDFNKYVEQTSPPTYDTMDDLSTGFTKMYSYTKSAFPSSSIEIDFLGVQGLNNLVLDWGYFSNIPPNPSPKANVIYQVRPGSPFYFEGKILQAAYNEGLRIAFSVSKDNITYIPVSSSDMTQVFHLFDPSYYISGYNSLTRFYVTIPNVGGETNYIKIEYPQDHYPANWDYNTYCNWSPSMTLVKYNQSSDVPFVSPFNNYISRQGDSLMDGTSPFRFVSFNSPYLFYNETPNWHLTDSWEMDTIFQTANQMGGRVIRTFVPPIFGGSCNLLSCYYGPNQPYGEEMFQNMDLALSKANQYQVRLIIPLIDMWSSEGGVTQFASLNGFSSAWEEFVNRREVINEFKNYISYILNRTNTITGIKYKDDKAILAWETGNELYAPDWWTQEIAAYLKSIDSNHLVMDGKHYGALDLSDTIINDRNVDIITAHFYDFINSTNYLSEMTNDRIRTANIKPYIIGEFGYSDYNDFKCLLDTGIDNGTAGIMMWCLMSLSKDGGFYGTHNYAAMHYPGAVRIGLMENERITYLRKSAYRIQNLAVPAKPIPEPPQLLPIHLTDDIRFKGSVGADSYIIERATNQNGPWISLADYTFEDNNYQPFNDTTAVIGIKYYYRVKAQNTSGISQPSNVIMFTQPSLLMVDNLNDFSMTNDHSANCVLDTSSANYLFDDASRLCRNDANTYYIEYLVPNNATQFEITSYGSLYDGEGLFRYFKPFQIYTSLDGTTYTQITDYIQLYNKNSNDDYPSVTRQKQWGSLPAGTQYIKFICDDIETPTWSPQIGRIVFYEKEDYALPTIKTSPNSSLSIDHIKKIITGVSPNTDVAVFTSMLSASTGTIKIVDTKNSIVTSGIIGTGMKIQLIVNSTVVDELLIIIYGDVNGDGKINLNDLIILRNHILENQLVDSNYKLAGDLYNEGDITLNAMVGIMSFISESGTINQRS